MLVIQEYKHICRLFRINEVVDEYTFNLYQSMKPSSLNVDKLKNSYQSILARLPTIIREVLKVRIPDELAVKVLCLQEVEQPPDVVEIMKLRRDVLEDIKYLILLAWIGANEKRLEKLCGSSS